MYRPKRHSGFDFDIFVEELSPKYIPALIFLAGILAALPYLFAADGEIEPLRLIIAAVLLPVAAFATHLVRMISDGYARWFWYIAIYTMSPVLLHGLAHFTGFIGLTATATFLHDWRWKILLLPYAAAFAYLIGIVIWHYLHSFWWNQLRRK